MYFALYKASNAPKGEGRTNVALATSRDGLEWRKHGILKVNGKVQPEYLQLYGGIFAGTMGPVFIGLTRRYLINGCGLARHFEAYNHRLQKHESGAPLQGLLEAPLSL